GGEGRLRPAVTLAIAAEGGGIACQHRLQLEGCRAGQGAQGGGVTGHPDLEVQHAQAAGEGAVLDGQGLDAVAGDDLQLAGEDAAAVDQRPGQQHGHPGAAADPEQGVGCVHPVDVPGPGGEQPFEGGEVVAGAERRGEVSMVRASSSRVPTGSAFSAPFSPLSSMPATVTVTAVQPGPRHSRGRLRWKRWMRPVAMLSVRVLSSPRRILSPRSVRRETNPQPASMRPSTYLGIAMKAGTRATRTGIETPSCQIDTPIATATPRRPATEPITKSASRSSERTSRPVGISAMGSPSVRPSGSSSWSGPLVGGAWDCSSAGSRAPRTCGPSSSVPVTWASAWPAPSEPAGGGAAPATCSSPSREATSGSLRSSATTCRIATRSCSAWAALMYSMSR